MAMGAVKKGRYSHEGAAATLFSGGILGAAALLWLAITLSVPGLGSVLAVFGSPILALCVILRLLTLPVERGRVAVTPERLIADITSDGEVLGRVTARQEHACFKCGGPEPLQLQLVLPIGYASKDIDRRLIAVCRACGRVPAGQKV